jgi:signal transduction histidine kinase
MLRLMTQPDRFRSILINLIGNAVEHNRSGGNVQIDCSPTEDPQTLRIEVRDDGPGIAPEHLPHVFEPFYRADPSRGVAAGAPSHLGLGLFLVQTHAQALGGSCQVQNVAVSGATFRVTLPGVVPPDASEQTLQAAPTAMREEASARRM